MAEVIRTAASWLGGDHLLSVKRAITNVLATQAAERTYSQILDGLPTIETWKEFEPIIKTHPVFEFNHAAVCKDAILKIRQFRSTFDPGQLRFRQTLLEAFRKTEAGSAEFDLRLVEITAVACHAVAVHLFQLDAGAHKQQLHKDWFASETQAQVLDGGPKYMVSLPLVPFRHRSYSAVHQYPDGEADMVGYWAETMIFGGVVVFDRGESDIDCKAVYLHDGRLEAPRTLYPPTEDQFRALMALLKLEAIPAQDGDDGGGSLPMPASSRNRYRWDPYYAMKDHHIFRDRYERNNTEGHRGTWRWSAKDWPEYNDRFIIMHAQLSRARGDPTPEEEEIKAAMEGLTQITPTSPLNRAPAHC